VAGEIPGYNVQVSLYTFIGELLLMFWLIWKGVIGFDRNLELK
jgi:hypothetical protein